MAALMAFTLRAEIPPTEKTMQLILRWNNPTLGERYIQRTNHYLYGIGKPRHHLVTEYAEYDLAFYDNDQEIACWLVDNTNAHFERGVNSPVMAVQFYDPVDRAQAVLKFSDYLYTLEENGNLTMPPCLRF